MKPPDSAGFRGCKVKWVRWDEGGCASSGDLVDVFKGFRELLVEVDVESVLKCEGVAEDRQKPARTVKKVDTSEPGDPLGVWCGGG